MFINKFDISNTTVFPFENDSGGFIRAIFWVPIPALENDIPNPIVTSCEYLQSCILSGCSFNT